MSTELSAALDTIKSLVSVIKTVSTFSADGTEETPNT